MKSMDSVAFRFAVETALTEKQFRELEREVSQMDKRFRDVSPGQLFKLKKAVGRKNMVEAFVQKHGRPTIITVRKEGV